MEKYFRAGHDTEQNVACAFHAGYQGYKCTSWGCVLLTAFPLQQWLHESAPVLRFTYIGFLVNL